MNIKHYLVLILTTKVTYIIPSVEYEQSLVKREN